MYLTSLQQSSHLCSISCTTYWKPIACSSECWVYTDGNTSTWGCAGSASIVCGGGGNFFPFSSWGFLSLALLLEADTFFNTDASWNLKCSLLQWLLNFLFVFSTALAILSISIDGTWLVGELNNSFSNNNVCGLGKCINISCSWGNRYCTGRSSACAEGEVGCGHDSKRAVAASNLFDLVVSVNFS